VSLFPASERKRRSARFAKLTVTWALLAFAGQVAGAGDTTARTEPRHYVFFGRDRARIRDREFLELRAIAGAQLKYLWRELEPREGVYTFQPLLEDLEFLERHGKRLVIQLQDVSFDSSLTVPDDLVRNPAFSGGVAAQFEFPDDDESQRGFGGWVALRWNAVVHARFVRLLDTLGRAVDGQIEALVLPETSVGFGSSGKLYPKGFTPAGYAEAIRTRMTAARRAFPRSLAIQYANFMPGEWLPSDDHGYLKGVYAHAESLGSGVGGPDLMPHRKGQRAHSLSLIAARSARVRAGVAVQDGNLAERDPTTKKRVTVEELARFARDPLRLDYIFWGTEEPYYSRDVLAYLRGLDARGAKR